MKVRQSFISNSSSTSFIVRTPEDFAFAKQHNLGLTYCVKILYQLKDIQEATERAMSNVPWFLHDKYALYAGYRSAIDDMERLLKDYPEAAITDPVDRDHAYKLGLQENLQIFENL